MIRFFAACLALAAACAAEAAAHGEDHEDACRARFAPASQVSMRMISPLSGAPSAETFELRLRNVSGDDCRFGIAFAEGRRAGGLARRGGAPLDFRIARDAAGANIVYDSRQPAAAARAHLRAGAREMRLYLIVAPGEAPRAGAYENNLRLTLFSGGGDDELDTLNLELEARVPEEVQAFISGASQAGGAYALINLDEITSGEIGRAALRIRATSDVRIHFESDNGGRLAQSAGGRIAYDLLADGEAVNLRRGGDKIETTIPLAARELGLEVRIGDTSRAPAGDYHDRVTITVSAQ